MPEPMKGRRMTPPTTKRSSMDIITIERGKLVATRTDSIEPIKAELLLNTLATAVPISIANLRAIGGPQDYHIEEVQRRLRDSRDEKAGPLSGFADMLFGGKQAGIEAELLCDMLAILAFQPGGVTAFGLHFEANCEEEIHAG